VPPGAVIRSIDQRLGDALRAAIGAGNARALGAGPVLTADR
jgi:hypothetical protein